MDDLYMEFKEMLKDAISDNSPGVEIEEGRVLKRNNQELDTLTLKSTDGLCPVVYPEALYEKFQQGMTTESIAKSILEQIKGDGMPNMPEFTRAEAERHVTVSLLNAEKNREFLTNCPNRPVKGTDLTETVRWQIDENTSFLVKNDMMESLKMTKEELFAAAESNLSREGYSIQSMQETMMGFLGDQGVPEEFAAEMMPDMGAPNLLVVSRDTFVDGSAVLLSDKVMQDVHERLGEDFYILPSSRHEVLCIGKSDVDDSRDLKAMVEDVNRSCLKPDDFLSDNTYMYNGKSHSLSMCREDGSFMVAESREINHSPRMAMGGM